MQQTLQGLRLGQCGRVTNLSGSMRDRLSDLGFTAGSEVRCLYASLLGDPRAYLIRGTVVALRCEDAQNIACEPMGGAL